MCCEAREVCASVSVATRVLPAGARCGAHNTMRFAKQHTHMRDLVRMSSVKMDCSEVVRQPHAQRLATAKTVGVQ